VIGDYRHEDIAPVARFANNGMAGGEGRYFDKVHTAAQNREAAQEQAQAELTNEFARALMRHPEHTVRAPNCEDALKRMSVLEAIRDDFDERDGDEVLSELLQIVTAAAKSGDLRAMAWVKNRAKAFGAWHGAELVQALEG
jgi:hypothetical protein